MKIAILGAGFTGLSAAYRLLQAGHQVTIFEKEKDAGGLAAGFTNPSWKWSLEKAYHHWFTNDQAVLSLAKELNHKVYIRRPSTDVFIAGNRLPFDSPTSLLTFPHLPLIDRIRTGIFVLYLKLIPNHSIFEGQKALPWIRDYMGKDSSSLIWEPLLQGKFGPFWEDVALTWFWARVKKRTPSLSYPEGGFQSFANNLSSKIKKLGGKIMLKCEIACIQKDSSGIKILGRNIPPQGWDKVIVTLPSPIFCQITPQLPKTYAERITSIPHLHAQVLILVLKKPFMKKTYWLNITDKEFPFLVLSEHTNFMDKKYYGNQHILYIGNYLPDNHPYLKMSKQQLVKLFTPYLKKINPNFQFSRLALASQRSGSRAKRAILNSQLLTLPFAQPVVTTNYPKLIPTFQTPLKGIYLANMDMVYPWDRGTNYAVEMGERVAEVVDHETIV